MVIDFERYLISGLYRFKDLFSRRRRRRAWLLILNGIYFWPVVAEKPC